MIIIVVIVTFTIVVVLVGLEIIYFVKHSKRWKPAPSIAVMSKALIIAWLPVHD